MSQVTGFNSKQNAYNIILCHINADLSKLNLVLIIFLRILVKQGLVHFPLVPSGVVAVSLH